jgi:hypothetical protein
MLQYCTVPLASLRTFGESSLSSPLSPILITSFGACILQLPYLVVSDTTQVTTTSHNHNHNHNPYPLSPETQLYTSSTGTAWREE